MLEIRGNIIIGIYNSSVLVNTRTSSYVYKPPVIHNFVIHIRPPPEVTPQHSGSPRKNTCFWKTEHFLKKCENLKNTQKQVKTVKTGMSGFST
jgi:competence transcription factor ComK